MFYFITVTVSLDRTHSYHFLNCTHVNPSQSSDAFPVSELRLGFSVGVVSESLASWLASSALTSSRTLKEQQACQDFDCGSCSVYSLRCASLQPTVNKHWAYNGTMRQQRAMLPICTPSLAFCTEALEAELMSLVELNFSGRSPKVWQHPTNSMKRQMSTLFRLSVHTFRLPSSEALTSNWGRTSSKTGHR